MVGRRNITYDYTKLNMNCQWDNENGPRICLVCGWHFRHAIAGRVVRVCGIKTTARIQPTPPTPEEIERRRIERRESYCGFCPYCETRFTSFESHKGHSPCQEENEALRLGLSPESYRAKPAAEKLGVTLGDIVHYAAALARWTKAGFPRREQTEVERIEAELCKPCEQYKNGRCGRCGCNVNASMALVNKIAMGTEKCPLGKW